MPGYDTQMLYKGTIAGNTTQYVGVPLGDRPSFIGLQIARLNTSTAGTWTLEGTNYGSIDAPWDVAGSAWLWVTSGLTLTDPGVPGAIFIHLGNDGFRRHRLKFVGAGVGQDIQLEIPLPTAKV